jgi:hypothetical protein
MPLPAGTFRIAAMVGGVLLGSGVVLLAACGSDEGKTPANESTFDGSGPSTPPGSSSGSSSFGTSSSGEPNGVDAACVSQEAEAITSKRPLDIIFVIDNSESMGDEIAEVENQINTNFINIIAASQTDYHVVMISSHGVHDATPGDSGIAHQRICVRAPLSGTTCEPVPAKPAETASFIHYDTVVESTDAWCKILNTFHGPADANGSHAQGWSKFLRPNAFKVFAVITDDRVFASCAGFHFDDKADDPISAAAAANNFETALFSLSPQFGTPGRRNYVWHSIVAVAPFDANDTTKPHPPGAPIVTQKCSTTAPAPGLGHQALSRATGGLRFPTCEADFTPIFKAMAEDAIERTVIACDYAMPKAPKGGRIDPATAVVRYTSGGVVTDFAQVADAASCGPNKFYIEGDRIKLCNDACNVVQADPSADVKILFGCRPDPKETK